MKDNKGFSLVEIMVVVSIIGILAAVAVPNFMTYQAKSKTTEAKFYLGQVFTAEESFYLEYETYGTCLEIMGLRPPNEDTDETGGYYTFGFQVDFVDPLPANSGCSATAEFYPATRGSGGGATTAASFVFSPTADRTTYEAEAIGNIHSTAQNDSWTIDQSKMITHRQVGY